MTFFEMAKASGGEGTLIAGVPEYYLIPISLGAVFCGAITYIGNGPNFMVKSVAESDGVPMPSFGRYIGYAFTLLVPVLAAMAMIFVDESWLVRGLGIALAAGLVFLVAGAYPSRGPGRGRGRLQRQGVVERAVLTDASRGRGRPAPPPHCTCCTSRHDSSTVVAFCRRCHLFSSPLVSSSGGPDDA